MERKFTSSHNQVYRLGYNTALLSSNTYWVYQSSYKIKDKIVHMKTPFDSVSSSRLYFQYLTAMKDCMHIVDL